MKSTFQQIVSEFNASHPDIELVHASFEQARFDTAVKTAFLGGSPPDILFLNPGGIMFQYAEAGLLADISQFVEQRRDIIPTRFDSFHMLGDRSFGVPFQLNVGNLLYFNTDILNKLGISPSDLRQWGSFVAANQTVADAGIWPIAFGNLEGWPGSHLYNHLLLRLVGPDKYTQIFLRTFDGTVRSDLQWTDPVAIHGWEMYLELRDRGFFSPGYLADSYATANALFLTGQAAFFINGSWFSGDLTSKAKNLNWGVLPFPVVDGYPGKYMDLVISGLVASISAGSKHPKEARIVLDYLISEPVQRLWAESNQRLSPLNYDSSKWEYSDQFRQIVDLLDNASSVVLFGDMLEDFACSKPWFWDASQGILIGSISAQEIGNLHEACVRRVRSQRGFVVDSHQP